MRPTKAVAFLALVFALLSPLNAALIPPFFLDCVVAIGVEVGGTKRWVASGFLFGELLRASGDERTYRIFLVTNRHNFEGRENVYVRFNPVEERPAQEYKLQLRHGNGNKLWFAHPDPEIDVAVIPVNVKFLREQGLRFSYFRSDKHVAGRTKAREIGLSEGDGVFVLGFPLNLVGGERSYVVLRQGAIARVRDTLAGASKEMLIDAFIFPGNSGGPVVVKPEFVSIKGTKPIKTAFLIGLVKGYVSYRDVAISAQTKRVRVVFEENAGLAVVIPIDFVREAIAEQLKATGSSDE